MRSKLESISVMLEMCDLYPDGTCRECQRPDEECGCLAGSIRTVMAMHEGLPFFPDDGTCAQMFIQHYQLPQDFVNALAGFVEQYHEDHNMPKPKGLAN